MHPSTKLVIKSSILLIAIIAISAIIPHFGAIILSLLFLGGLYNAWYNAKHPNTLNKRVDYHSYLQSTQWQDKRSLVLIRDRYRCVKCTSKLSLHVHHIHYFNLGSEPLEDLVTLCASCHKKVHEYHGSNARYYDIYFNTET